jgi:hypothetical protein
MTADLEAVRADATALITASLHGGPKAVDALLEQTLASHVRAGRNDLIEYAFTLAGVLAHHAAVLHRWHFAERAGEAQQRLALALALGDSTEQAPDGPDDGPEQA